MADEGTALVRVRGLNVHFKSQRGGGVVRAVDGVDLDVNRGETLCLVGESGSGKTTLVQAIGHLVPFTSGSVVVDGVDVARLRGRRLKAYRRHMQFVFQDPFESFNPRQSIWTIISEPLQIHQLARDRVDMEARVFEALVECGLPGTHEFAKLFPHQLSGGQRQRVAIAAAIVLRPEVLIADEPVSMLDVSIRSEILSLFLRLKESHNMTLVLVTHDLSVAWEIADRIVVLYLGRVFEQGTANDVIGAPANPYTHALVAAIPVPNPHHAVREVAVKGDIADIVGIPVGCRFHPRCPYAIDACVTDVPSLRPVAEGHLSACLRNEELDLEPPHELAEE